MAKDGTNRGGPRPGTGPKRKPLVDKITDGTAKGTLVMPDDFPEPTDIEGEDIPPVRDYLKAKQKNGSELCAEEIFRETYLWLRKRGCESLVNNQLIEQYAMSSARYIQCEEMVNKYGMIAKHPTTGAAIQSPYVKMSQDFLKQINTIWYSIAQVVKDNCASGYGNPKDDPMERLLNKRRFL